MNTLQRLTWLALFIGTLSGSLLTDMSGFLYGVAVSMTGLGIYYGFYRCHRRRVSAYPGQALVVVISSTVVRFVLLGLLLVYGWVYLHLQPESLILGFVLGQFFYLINQFITVKTSHGK